jgi:hypothetical protein
VEKRHWLIIAAVVLALLWLQAEADRWRLRREINRVYLGDVTIQTIDADTKAPITITFHGPPSTMDQRWPKAFTISTTGDLSKMWIRWIDVGDVNVGVSAEGYEGVPVTVNAATSRELVIPLRRSDLPTNQPMQRPRRE